MSNFMDGIKSTLNNECNVSVTENGAVGFRTTGKALLDLNFAVASLRSASEHDISQRFTKAFFEDKLMAMKWLFYARDVRGGLGERRLFRACMVPLAKEFPEYVAPVVALVPEYGRWDDLWCLLDTPACDCVTGLVKGQLYDDTQNAAEDKPISLLAKWMPRCKTSSKQTRHYAQILRKAVGMTERQYQHSVNRAIDRICAAYIEDETVLADQEGRDPVLIRHFSAHNLRHTFCTRFCENERNIKVIQEIMGHADIETTMNTYAEATKEKKKESFSNLEGKIKIS